MDDIKTIVKKIDEIYKTEYHENLDTEKMLIENALTDYLSSQFEQLVKLKIADTDWKPVEDLPADNSGYYLCYTKYIYNDNKPQYFYETARIEDRQWYAPNGENITDNVIYWKELPKAPVESNFSV